jgi:hypothetical protein
MFRKFLAVLAATTALTGNAGAQSGPLDLGGFEFNPPAEVFISTDPLSFVDNTILQVGGRNATFNGQPMVVYSLERDYGDPVGPTQYTAFPNVPTIIGQLFTVAGTPTTAVQSGALQLAIWMLNGTQNFDIVDDLDGAGALAQIWISQINSETPTTSLVSLQNKHFNYFVTASPVPEAPTAALLLAGLGICALVFNRKSRRG